MVPLLCLFDFDLKLADLYFYKKASHWITINYQILAYVRKFTYLSAAKNSNREYQTYGKGKHKIWENHSFRRNLLRKQGFLCPKLEFRNLTFANGLRTDKRLKHPSPFIYSSDSPVFIGVQRKIWRVKGFCVIHFYKYCFSKNAYLRHICAQRRAQMCLSKSNYTEKEVKFVTTALSKPQCDTGMLGAYFGSPDKSGGKFFNSL